MLNCIVENRTVFDFETCNKNGVDGMPPQQQKENESFVTEYVESISP